MTLVSDLLTDWGYRDHISTLCSAETSSISLEALSPSEASAWLNINGPVDDDCKFYIRPSLLEGMPKFTIKFIGSTRPKSRLEIILLQFVPGLSINIGGSSSRVFVGRGSYKFSASVLIYNKSDFFLGDEATSNGCRIFADNSSIIIGRDTMISDEVILQSNDQHGIVDVATMRLVNASRSHLHLGQHTWIGRRAMVMPNVSVGAGSILGAGSTLTRDVEPCTAYAGVPARLVKTGVTWSRKPYSISADEEALITGMIAR